MWEKINQILQSDFTVLAVIVGALATVIGSYIPLSKHYYDLKNDYETKSIEQFKQVYLPGLLGLKKQGNFFLNNDGTIDDVNYSIIRDHGYLLNIKLFKLFLELYELELLINSSNDETAKYEHKYLKILLHELLQKQMNEEKELYDNITRKIKIKYGRGLSSKVFLNTINLVIFLSVITYILFFLDNFGYLIGASGNLFSKLIYLFILLLFIAMPVWIYIRFSGPIKFDSIAYLNRRVVKSDTYKCKVCSHTQVMFKYQKFPRCPKHKNERIILHNLRFINEDLWKPTNNGFLLNNFAEPINQTAETNNP